jgi:hypothetical protein
VYNVPRDKWIIGFGVMGDNELLEYINNKLTHGKPITVTADYSCLDKEQQPDMDTIWGWSEKGIIKLEGTEAMVKEFDRASPGVREKLEEQYLRLDKLKPLPGTPGASFNRAQFNRTPFNRGGTPPTTRDGKDVNYYFSEFRRLMFPSGFHRESDSHDVMHISIHYLFARDIFLTKNPRHFPKDRLQQRFEDLAILTPDNFVNLFNRVLSSIKRQG